jgi:hypothetical protein
MGPTQSSGTSLTFGIILGLASATFSVPAYAQPTNESAELALPLSANACSPECAPGFECNEGFCLAIESKPAALSDGSVAAPGLALGELAPATPTPSRKPPARRALPPPKEDDDDGDDRPKTEDVQEWSDYRHQGFYLRFGLGAGVGWLTGNPDTLSSFGRERIAGDAMAEGDFSIGGSVGPVAFGYRALVSPLVGFSGGFVDVYPDPLEGLHIEGSFGIDGTDTGAATAILGVGHDFFFAREWSFGLTARALHTFDVLSISSVSLSLSLLCH